MIDQTHGGWIPPQEPSASCRARIQRSARRSARRGAADRRRSGRPRSSRAGADRRVRSSRAGFDRAQRHARARARRRSAAPSRRSRRRRTGRRRQQAPAPAGSTGHPLPRPLPEEREEALREDAGSSECRRVRPDELAVAFAPGSTPHSGVRRTPRSSSRSRRGPRTRSTTCRRRACAPSARSRSAGPSRACAARAVVPEQVLRGHRHVRLELAHPDAVGALQLEQPPRAPVDRGIEAVNSSRGAHHSPPAGS